MLVTCLYACDQDNIFDTQEQLRNDVALIEQYIAENNINATAFENGLHIAIESVGTGNNPEFGSTVVCHYRGYLLDGTEFDTSEGRDPFDFVIGRGDVIQGWDLAFREVNKGTRGTIFIPSSLGYGNRRQNQIPPNSVLIFDFSLLDIR